MEFIEGVSRYPDEAVLAKIKDSASNIGKTFKKNRYRIEQIFFGRGIAYHRYGGKYPAEVVNEEEGLSRHVFYYIDNSGLIYKSYVESKDGGFLANDWGCRDDVVCQIVGLLPTHNDGDLVRR